MPYHDWSDDSFDWDSLNKAISLIWSICTRYGRIGIHSKEKFGTHRCSSYLFDGTLHSLVKPGHVYNRWSKRARWIDYSIFAPMAKRTGAIWLIHKYQATIYNFAFQLACFRYPHIIDEIVSGVDGYPMIRPGIFGEVDGTVIHNKHWITLS